MAAAGPAPLAAQSVTKTIPIVMTNHGDPVGTGLVASLARPGGNITGLSLLNPEIIGKQLQLLKEVIPRLSRVAVLRNPTNKIHSLSLKEVEVAARSLRVQLQTFEARGSEELDGAFAAMTRARRGALGSGGCDVLPQPHADRRPRGKAAPANDVRAEAGCGGRWAHGLWGQTNPACFVEPPRSWTRS